jgi:hypothetical protein
MCWVFFALPGGLWPTIKNSVREVDGTYESEPRSTRDVAECYKLDDNENSKYGIMRGYGVYREGLVLKKQEECEENDPVDCYY